MKHFISVILCCLLLLTSVGCQREYNGRTVPAKEDLTTILTDAYVFTLPLMVMDATFRTSTNTEAATSVRAPKNQFLHAEKLATADFKSVVTPNVDTIYSQVFLDLSEDSVVIEIPKTNRFCNVEIMDAYSNCIRILDAQVFSNEKEKFLFTYGNVEDEVRGFTEEIKCPTPMMWILIRTVCNDKGDEPNVHAIQAEMDAYTYTQYKNGTTADKPKGTYDEKNDIVPSSYVLGLDIQSYFERANILLAENPPFDEDREMVERIATINVGAALSFDKTIFGDKVDEIWANIVKNINSITTEKSAQYIKQNGKWTYFGAPIAEFGTAYYYRAFIALFGFGANPVSVAVYPKTTQDENGDRLNGANSYVLHFDKEQIPATEENGFWSVTAYNSEDNFLIDNEIDRYCINDRSDVVYNEDGSLDIYIQKEKPVGNEDNWLPVCDGNFHFVLRVYLPQEHIVKNEWVIPQVAKQ